MSDRLHAIAEVCINMGQTQSRAAVRETLKAAIPIFGTSFVLFGMRTGRSITPPRQLVITTYPKAWQDYYDANNAYAFDPVINKAFQSEGAFRWDGLHHDPRQLALRRESVRNGMEFGFSCADRGSDGSLAILSFCGGQPIAREPDQWEQVAAAAALLTSVTNKAVTRIIEATAKTFGKALSLSELKTLEIIGAGHTGKQAAAILGVKPRTIRYYLDRAAEKLGVDTRKEAILKAVADGIVDTREFPPAGFSSATAKDEG
ncbi:MAG: LuxR family transcriptional regulator [Nevskia sp.]|nr:LuxR family transcriptional regulator [Nevskia sp.]